MPRFEPYAESGHLPAEGGRYERSTLDLKLRVDPKGRFQFAKDVAAFANHLGGTLLIGARERNGCVGEYQPLDEKAANETQAAFSQAVRDRCSPLPIVEFTRIQSGPRVVTYRPARDRNQARRAA